jgi:hypothetical protein
VNSARIDDPRWIDWREVVELSGLDAAGAANLLDRKILPPPKDQAVFENGRWQRGLRWWRPSVELNLAQWRVSIKR